MSGSGTKCSRAEPAGVAIPQEEHVQKLLHDTVPNQCWSTKLLVANCELPLYIDSHTLIIQESNERILDVRVHLIVPDIRLRADLLWPRTSLRLVGRGRCP